MTDTDERDPACWPTPEQFAAEWERLPEPDRLTFARVLISAAQAAEDLNYEASMRDQLISQFEARALKAEQECRDRECTEADVRARLADAENALADLREQLRDAQVRLDEQRRMTDAAEAAAERRLDQSIMWTDRAERAENTLARVRVLAAGWTSSSAKTAVGIVKRGCAVEISDVLDGTS